ncbi:MAG TPA: GLPGLI family protein [Puia sp.]|jgi:GLPGLI family protein|nr:GLPGLI family protein [Puia sp.]
MIRASIFLLSLAIAAQPLRAQNNIFLSQGKIEFERKVNQYAQREAVSDPGDEAWTEFSKKLMGNKFKTDYFDLLFTRTKTLYRPGRETPDKPNPFFFEAPGQENIIYADLEQEKSVSQKLVFEQTFLVADTLRRIKWKITDETRVIAGFNCRRANAIVMDSIYVVAFYTDEILTTGGPESFSGLPGMILGVALPHEHVSWFATKVEAIPVTEAQVVAPAKGKRTTNSGLLETIQKSLKDWGKEGRLFMEDVML